MRQWVLLHYRVPPSPSARRVYVWRKLKNLGAILLHDSVWVLPDTAWTYEQFQWLVTEIADVHGEAMLWQAHLTLPGQEQTLINRFLAASEREYEPLWQALQQDAPDLSALSRQFQEVRRRDYFACSLGQQIYDALTRAREE
ncbi:Hypothetical protein DEACI_4230 [Acididesulfobacillus acetoxydans]|uniref:ChrB protein n=1 Tax=Acididesulfobacillus acetoxydans TaxID=1561005 RepID=A0A8S0Y0R7_9FIRM|nr:Chromate resistance protein ChrB [Acididesulfobacillus acetoxydans]CAA7603407.1 Hypothetical protein DEACI_4230 [Acididesulfobacillus acetoxydans]CEJ06496.1 ChrB protein [Acididesulfobacillus acetoxydans]